MALSSFMPSIAQREQEEKLNFANLSINKTMAVKQVVMEAIRVSDEGRPGNRRMFARRA
jgi:hypothetical protein